MSCSKSSKKDELFKIQQGVGEILLKARGGKRERESDAGAGDEQRDDEEEEEEEEKDYDEKDDGEDVEE